MKLSRKQFLAACAALALPIESVASLIVVDKSRPLKDPPHAEWWRCGCEDCEEWHEALREHVQEAVERSLDVFWRSIREQYAPLLKGNSPQGAIDASDVESTIANAVEDWISGAFEKKPLPQRPNYCPVGFDHRHQYFGTEEGICPLCSQRLWPE